MQTLYAPTLSGFHADLLFPCEEELGAVGTPMDRAAEMVHEAIAQVSPVMTIQPITWNVEPIGMNPEVFDHPETGEKGLIKVATAIVGSYSVIFLMEL